MQPLSASPREISSKMPRPRPWSLMLNKFWCARFKTSTGSGWCGFFWILRISIPFLNWRFSKPLVGWISYPIIFSWFRNSDPVSLHEGWRGFLFLHTSLLDFWHRWGRAASLPLKVVWHEFLASPSGWRGALFLGGCLRCFSCRRDHGRQWLFVPKMTPR